MAVGLARAVIPAADGTGQYIVTIDRDVTGCIPVATLASDDAAFPQAGLVAVGRPNGIPPNQFQILTRNTSGTLTDIGSVGGTYGISLAVYCP